MSLTVSRPSCGACGDRLQASGVDCCGRCHRVVCRACSRRRGRSHETVLCLDCSGRQETRRLRANPIYRAFRRLLAG